MTDDKQTRCVNLDWLEVHCLEPFGLPRNADYFRRAGYVVHEREYGTRVYREMFTLDGTDGEPLLEVRRNPASQGIDGIHAAEECHIRLHNRTCYFNDAAAQLKQFLEDHAYTFQRITRVDICLDFERFDYGDDPQDFLNRYIKHRYAKINQANRTTHGVDRWAGCIDNSVSWGSPSSDIGTKMYNKTMELYNQHDASFSKPYILWNWKEAGLIDNPIHCTKGEGDSCYRPDIWRVEFSIRSSVKWWFKIERDGKPKNYQSIRNTLDMYDGRDKLLVMFASLAQHYFHFKKYEPNKRKDRCDDKLLFNFKGVQLTYKVGKATLIIGTRTNGTDPLNSLINKIRYYQSTHNSAKIHKACDVLIEAMESETTRSHLRNLWSYEDIVTLQQALSMKADGDRHDVAVLMREIKQLLHINDNTAIF